jgi:hypothetical protein
MYLVVKHTKIPEPSDTQIVAADLTEDGNRFAILGIDDQTYIQTAIRPHGFVVAYREGPEESHCESTSQTHDVETVKNLFLLYHAQDPRYKTLVEYRPWQSPSPSLFRARIRDLTAWGWLVAILSLVAVLSAFMPVAYRIVSELSLEGDHVEDVALLAILFVVVTVIVFSIAGVLVKWFGIRCFARTDGCRRSTTFGGRE